ncbi:50S ribosomal protein L34e [Candidatus Woesearchaeota archaeon]|nr:50S ribosomal protein L34e [Candidatus Woesearchaeota archaeon]
MRPSKQKSRSLRRVFRKTPGGVTKVAYAHRNPSKAHCAQCHSELVGMKRLRPFRLSNVSKSQRRPNRPFGGVLCSSCVRKVFVGRVRSGV